MRLIDADAMIERHCECCKKEIRECCKTDPVCGSLMWLAEAPTVDPESLRPKGQWIVNRRHTVSKNPYLDDNYHIDVICSECSFCIQAENASFDFPEPIKTNYCPNCGADMRGEEDGTP